MKKITYVILLLLLVVNKSFAQATIISKRIEIKNPTENELLQLKDAGFDLSCGAIFNEKNLLLEVGSFELNKINELNIDYDIKIDDLINYYKKKTEIELPVAKMQLEQMKQQSSSQRSVSTQTESIDNFIQYEGCNEVDWTIPQNFDLGSMAGCLTYSEVLDELDEMRALYPNLISVKTDASPTNQTTYGNSYTNGGQYDTWAGQPIYYVRISDNPDVDEINEPESLYSGMTHSREVSSMMNLIFYMWYILENYDTDPGIKQLVDNHEMYFIPVANPDGLMWNEQIAPSGGGLQRKNLGPYNTGNNNSRGVDLNRNYDYFWGPNPIYGGSSGTQSNQTYRGPSAFSEPETQIVRDFSATRNFKTAMNHHATSNLIPHAYNGYPAAPASGREAEYHKFCHDMTRFNRYIYGEAPDILTIANGDMSDWMLGGAADVNGSTGSGQGILALAPENGAWDGSEGGFWPNSTEIVDIAKRAMRMNFANVYHSGKFAQFHDLNTSDVTTLSGTFDFGIEYLGQTLGDITLNVTPVSSNLTSITSPSTQTGWNKLEQRTLTSNYTLDSGIQPNDIIEFQITLSNDDGYIIYQANIIKYYTPTVLATDNPDALGMSNWSTSGGSWGTTSDSYSGTTAITDSPSGSYSNNVNKAITFNSSVDLSNVAGAVVQYYAKWDLERNFDYVQIQGSTDGSNWINLCGKYTKPGSDYLTNRYSSSFSTNTSTGKSTSDQNNQPTGELLYDGDTMDKWVMEEIFIDGTNNSALLGASNVQFRFLFNSDNSNRADGYPTTFDGFIFDDFKVISLSDVPCSEIVDQFPYDESFENGLGLWSQGSGDDIDFSFNDYENYAGGTPSNNTGPSSASYGTFYLFTEASTNVTPSGSPNKSAELISPCFDLTDFINPEFSFDYHMFGNNITAGDNPSSTIELFVSTNNGKTYSSILLLDPSSENLWKTQLVDLSSYVGQSIKLKINVITGDGFASDIAIDNFYFNATQNTLNTENFDINNISIYPNPFDNSININLSQSNYNNHSIQIFDISGRTIQFIKSNKQNIKIDNLGNLSVGTYFVKIKDLDSGLTTIKKLIKN